VPGKAINQHFLNPGFLVSSLQNILFSKGKIPKSKTLPASPSTTPIAEQVKVKHFLKGPLVG
jgi:hypothetical protein